MSSIRVPHSSPSESKPWEPACDDPGYVEFQLRSRQPPFGRMPNMTNAARSLPITYGMEMSMKSRTLRMGDRPKPSSVGEDFGPLLFARSEYPSSYRIYNNWILMFIG